MGKKKETTLKKGEAEAKYFINNPFSELKIQGLEEFRQDQTHGETKEDQSKFRPKTSSNLGPTSTLYIRLSKKRRSGKVVTLITEFDPRDQKLIPKLAKQLRKSLGTGGTFTFDSIGIQGDYRRKSAEWFKDKGFQVKGEIT